MITKTYIKFFSEIDFDNHPLWKHDDISDSYCPINSIDEFPDFCNRDLFVRAKFYTPIGIELKGYLVGVINVYCIALFINGKKLFFNKNLPDMCLENFFKLAESLSLNKKLVPVDIFPIKYETTIDLEGFKNISGEFNALEKVKELGK